MLLLSGVVDARLADGYKNVPLGHGDFFGSILFFSSLGHYSVSMPRGLKWTVYCSYTMASQVNRTLFLRKESSVLRPGANPATRAVFTSTVGIQPIFMLE